MYNYILGSVFYGQLLDTHLRLEISHRNIPLKDVQNLILIFILTHTTLKRGFKKIMN